MGQKQDTDPFYEYCVSVQPEFEPELEDILGLYDIIDGEDTCELYYDNK